MDGCYAEALKQIKDQLMSAMHDDFQNVEGPLKARLESARTIDAIIEAFQEWLRSFDQDACTDDLIWLIGTDNEVAALVQSFLDTNAAGRATT